jgi:hypothetical protein
MSAQVQKRRSRDAAHHPKKQKKKKATQNDNDEQDDDPGRTSSLGKSQDMALVQVHGPPGLHPAFSGYPDTMSRTHHVM